MVLEVTREGDWARITVVDTGNGIAPEQLPRVFDRFYHGETGRRRTTGGAGLGLAFVAQLVRLMHGQLRLESTLGRGTTATILLPLARDGPRGA